MSTLRLEDIANQVQEFKVKVKQLNQRFESNMELFDTNMEKMKSLQIDSGVSNTNEPKTPKASLKTTDDGNSNKKRFSFTEPSKRVSFTEPIQSPPSKGEFKTEDKQPTNDSAIISSKFISSKSDNNATTPSKGEKKHYVHMQKYCHGMSQKTFDRLVKVPVQKTSTNDEEKPIIEMNIGGVILHLDSQRFEKPMSAFKRFQRDQVALVCMNTRPFDEKKVEETLFQMQKGDEKLCREYQIEDIKLLKKHQEEEWQTEVNQWEKEVKTWLDYVEPILVSFYAGETPSTLQNKLATSTSGKIIKSGESKLEFITEDKEKAAKETSKPTQNIEFVDNTINQGYSWNNQGQYNIYEHKSFEHKQGKTLATEQKPVQNRGYNSYNKRRKNK